MKISSFKISSFICWLCLLMVTAVAIVVLATVIFREFQQAQEVATQSTIASINQSLNASTLGNSLTPSSKWIVLNDSEYDDLMQALLKTGQIDMGPSRLTNERVLVDAWGNRFQVAVRKNEEGEFEWDVWARGSKQGK